MNTEPGLYEVLLKHSTEEIWPHKPEMTNQNCLQRRESIRGLKSEHPGPEYDFRVASLPLVLNKCRVVTFYVKRNWKENTHLWVRVNIGMGKKIIVLGKSNLIELQEILNILRLHHKRFVSNLLKI